MADTTDSTNFSSSNLVSGSFNSDTNEMTVTFHGGKPYTWTDVSASQWQGLKSAFSPGRYLRDNFGPGEPG